MSELLAPAGNMDAFYAAVSNGADAIYVGLNSFSARAYAKNFTFDELKEALCYAHLRNVKIYVTMNTIIFESELPDVYSTIDLLYKIGIDGIIAQDLAIIEYINSKYSNLEAHASTQMGIDDLFGVRLLERLGIKRVVLSRELSLEDIKKIKKNTKIPLEVFIHGALCVSYSGNCLMSGLIGFRSGNRGRCVGSCRGKYKLINTTKNEVISDDYILSMKDLNTIDSIDKLKFIDSLKIEGRMKEPYYVANVVSAYRKALDDSNYSKDELRKKLNMTFNRTYTKGYISNEDKKNITNTLKPNNYGYYIGKVTKIINQRVEISLNEVLNQGDAIRLYSNDGNEINTSIVKLYDGGGKLVNSCSKKAYIDLEENVGINSLVFKTKDTKYIDELNKSYPKEYRRLPLSFIISGNINNPLILTAYYKDFYATVTGPNVDEALNNPIDINFVKKQLDRLNDTPYYLDNVIFELQDNSFISAKTINNLRRECIQKLNEMRLYRKQEVINKSFFPKNISYPVQDVKLACFCTTLEQYKAAKDENISIIYYDNYVRRNQNNYGNLDSKCDILVGGYGGLEYYLNSKPVTDFSFNVVNSRTVKILHGLGAKRVTLSYEINKVQIEQLLNSYYSENKGYPNLEMIVYGRQDLMFTKYCPLKNKNLCGMCNTDSFEIEDEYSHFPIISNNDCTTTILNSRILNLIDDLDKIKNINVFRLQFRLESYEECINVIRAFKAKLKGEPHNLHFDGKINTRGQFNKEIM